MTGASWCRYCTVKRYALKRNSKDPGTTRELPVGARQQGRNLELTLKQPTERVRAYVCMYPMHY